MARAQDRRRFSSILKRARNSFQARRVMSRFVCRGFRGEGQKVPWKIVLGGIFVFKYVEFTIASPCRFNPLRFVKVFRSHRSPVRALAIGYLLNPFTNFKNM
jgi:hypothetical protein